MPPKPGRDRLDGRDDLVGVLRREADRPRVDAAELLEEQRLALHHRHRGLGADVAEPEHRAAVGDDGDGVPLDRQVPGALGVVGDRLADARDAGRVGHRQVVARLHGRVRVHVDLAAEVQQERAVGDALDLDARRRRAQAATIRSACSASVANTLMSRIFVARIDADEVDRVEQAAGVGDRAGEVGEAARAGRRASRAA